MVLRSITVNSMDSGPCGVVTAAVAMIGYRRACHDVRLLTVTGVVCSERVSNPANQCHRLDAAVDILYGSTAAISR